MDGTQYDNMGLSCFILPPPLSFYLFSTFFTFVFGFLVCLFVCLLCFSNSPPIVSVRMYAYTNLSVCLRVWLNTIFN